MNLSLARNLHTSQWLQAGTAFRVTHGSADPRQHHSKAMEPEQGADTQHFKTVLLAHEQARVQAWTGKNWQAPEVIRAPEFVEIDVPGRLSKSELRGRLFPTPTLHDVAIKRPALVPAGLLSAIFPYRCREIFRRTRSASPKRSLFPHTP